MKRSISRVFLSIEITSFLGTDSTGGAGRPAKEERETNKIILPRPCNGEYYADWKLGDWLLKVCEEAGEAVQAAKVYKKGAADAETQVLEEYELWADLCKELTDVITAATSALEFIGCGLEDRQVFQQEINDSNARRNGGRRFKEDA